MRTAHLNAPFVLLLLAGATAVEAHVKLRRRFVDGPVLTMRAAGTGTSDTTGSVGIPGIGTVFLHDFTLSAKWGRLDANGGVLRAADGATLSAPRPGSFAIVREK